MPLKCLVLSADEKTLFTLAKVLAELRIEAEVCAEASIALEKLERDHYEAVVVDCDGVAAGGLVLKGMHKTPLNKTSVGFAIIDDKTSLQAAHKMSAHFVLSKPLSPDRTLQTFRAGFGLMVRERRRSYRCPFELPVDIDRSSRTIPARSSNVSESGLAVQAAETLPGRGELRLRFSLEGSKVIIQSDGQIAWAGPHGEAGLEFVHMPSSSRRELENWLAKKMEEEERPATAISPPAPRVSKARKQLYWAIKVTRIAVSWGTMIWPLGFLLYFLIVGGMINPQKLEGTVVMAFLQAAVVPVVSWAKSLITMRVAYQKWDFLILGLGLAAFFARVLVLMPLERVEDWAQPKQTSR